MFDGSLPIDFVGDGSFDDTLSIRTTLDGVIDETGFGGTVGGSASLAIAGNPPTDLNLALSNSTVDGKFFGNAANVASGNYSATMALTAPGEPTETGTFSGFFIADR